MGADEEDPLAENLKRRDRAFLFRVALRLAVVGLLGLWLFLVMDESGVGGCAARSFTDFTSSS